MIKALSIKFQQCFSARLPCYFPKGPLKGDFLDIYLATFFGVRKFKNTSAMIVTFLLEILKIEFKFPNCKKKKKKIKKKFFVSEKFLFLGNFLLFCFASKNVAINCLG